MANNALYLPNWTVTDVKVDERYDIEASYDIVPEACPKCGVVGRFVSHGPKVTKYVDAPVHGKKTVIHVAVKRFKCRECGDTFLQSLPDMAPDRRMTLRCYNHIAVQSLIRPTLHIARDVGVDEKTCRNIQREYIAKLLNERELYAPQVLGIDEVNLTNGLCAVLVDVFGRKVLDLLETNSKARVGHWMAHLPGRERVSYLTMDMWRSYADLAAIYLPQAVVVVDKFHVVRTANKHLDAVRVSAARKLNTMKAQRAAMRGRLLLQKSRHRLSPRAAFVLDGWLSNSPTVKRAWEAKEAFYDIWDCTSRAAAEGAFEEWKVQFADIPEFVKLGKTVDNWHKEVFAYFDTGLTNAFTEAANGILKIANRLGRGYSIDVLRARIVNRNPAREADLFVCDYCRGIYPKGETISAKHLVPFKARKTFRNLAVSCEECNRVHTERWFIEPHHSAPSPR
jgi:transposase